MLVSLQVSSTYIWHAQGTKKQCQRPRPQSQDLELLLTKSAEGDIEASGIEVLPKALCGFRYVFVQVWWKLLQSRKSGWVQKSLLKSYVVGIPESGNTRRSLVNRLCALGREDTPRNSGRSVWYPCDFARIFLKTPESITRLLYLEHRLKAAKSWYITMYAFQPCWCAK